MDFTPRCHYGGYIVWTAETVPTSPENTQFYRLSTLDHDELFSACPRCNPCSEFIPVYVPISRAEALAWAEAHK